MEFFKEFIATIDMVALIEIGIAFALKIADNTLGTFKTIFIAKGKYVMASVFNAASTMFYLLAIVRITSSNSFASMLAMCAATFLGTLLPSFLLKKTERDKLYIFDITADTMEAGFDFADTLRSSNIAVNTSPVYNKNMEKTLAIKAYCPSKESSRKVIELLEGKDNFKYNVYAPIEE